MSHKHSRFSKYGFELSYPRSYQFKVLTGIKYSVVKYKNKQPNGWGGYTTLSKRPENWKESARETAERHMGKAMFSKEIFKQNTNNLIHIAKLCKDHHVKLIIVTPPAASCYYNYVTNDVKNNMRYMVAEAKQIKTDVVYLNLLSDNRFNDDDFFDPDHLNMDYGAVKYSKVINNIIEKYDR